MTRAKRFITYLRKKTGLFYFRLYMNAYKFVECYKHPTFDDCMNQIALHNTEEQVRGLECYWDDFNYRDMPPLISETCFQKSHTQCDSKINMENTGTMQVD